MLKSQISQSLQNILSDATAIQNMIEKCPDVIVDTGVLTELYESLDGIARTSTCAMNDLTLGSDIDMCMTELNRW